MDSSSQAYEISFKALGIKIRTIQIFCLSNFKPPRFALSTFAPSPPDQERKGRCLCPTFQRERAPSSSAPTTLAPAGAKSKVSKASAAHQPKANYYALVRKVSSPNYLCLSKCQALKPFIFNCSAYRVPWHFEIHSLKFLIKILYVSISLYPLKTP